MKKIKFAKALTALLTVYWIVYNTYFGWNLKPINEIEAMHDTIFRFGMYFAIGIFLIPLFDLFESMVRFQENVKSIKSEKETQESPKEEKPPFEIPKNCGTCRFDRMFNEYNHYRCKRCNDFELWEGVPNV